MTQSDKQYIYSRERPSEEEVGEIVQLAKLIDVHDALHLHSFISTILEQRTGKETFDFLYYEQGQLVGYLGIDNYGMAEKEFMCCVHPDFRRRGIATLLVRSAKEMGRHSGIEQLLMVCEKSSTSGIAFARALNARVDFAEHAMVLGTLQKRSLLDNSDSRLIFRKVMNDVDIAGVVAVMATDMSSTAHAERYVQRALTRQNEQFYLLLLNDGQEQAIGSLRLVQQPESIGIYGFVVRPEYRGKGYGRQLLQEVIGIAQAEGAKRITLEVDENNVSALHLYLSAGFEIETTYSYYALAK